MSSFTPAQTDDVSIATIRALAADVVAKANSGHPGKQISKLSTQRSMLILAQVLRWAWLPSRISFLLGMLIDRICVAKILTSLC